VASKTQAAAADSGGGGGGGGSVGSGFRDGGHRVRLSGWTEKDNHDHGDAAAHTQWGGREGGRRTRAAKLRAEEPARLQ